MYRQLWIALILSTMIALAGSLLASTLGARIYLKEQLRMKNADNATALALSLSNKNVDAIEMELAVAALFDRGHYESIRILSPAGALLVERRSARIHHDVPGWFIESLPVEAAPGEALISDGWKQIGKVVLASHSRFAYQELWNTTVRMSFALLFAGLLGAYLGTLILRRLKRPLDSVIEQANAITERRFMTIPEPAVPELRQLSSAMNSTVLRLKAMFEEEATRLEEVRKEANFDALTGLANREHFMAQLRAALDGEEARGGNLLLLRVANLAAINQKLGRQRTDELIQAVGHTVKDFAKAQRDSIAGRLNGADLAVLLDDGDGVPRAEELLSEVVKRSFMLNQDAPLAYIAVARFGPATQFSALLAGVDAAVAKLEADGTNAVADVALPTAPETPRSSVQWVQMIRAALDQQRVKLVSFPVTDCRGAVIHQECPVRLQLVQDGEWAPAGQFLPMAERLGLTAALDLAAVRLGLLDLRAAPALAGLAINLSGSSIKDPAFRKSLLELLKADTAAAHRLWLEISENGALTHLDAFSAFCQEMAGTGCKLGIEHFGRQFSQIGKLHGLGLHYLKVDASFIRGIDGHSGNQAFLKGLASIAHNIGMLVFAEGVTTAAELQTLPALGFDGATGPAVKNS